MKYWLDTEFLETPGTIDLISIGIASEDGGGYYAECREFDWRKADDWLLTNVRPHLSGPSKPRAVIADDILHFVGPDAKPEFWGFYADYDWVVFCWLFGRMIDLPSGWPGYCLDLKQWAVELGSPTLPPKLGNAHNALDDARWHQEIWHFLNDLSQQRAS